MSMILTAATAFLGLLKYSLGADTFWNKFEMAQHMLVKGTFPPGMMVQLAVVVSARV